MKGRLQAGPFFRPFFTIILLTLALVNANMASLLTFGHPARGNVSLSLQAECKLQKRKALRTLRGGLYLDPAVVFSFHVAVITIKSGKTPVFAVAAGFAGAAASSLLPLFSHVATVL